MLTWLKAFFTLNVLNIISDSTEFPSKRWPKTGLVPLSLVKTEVKYLFKRDAFSVSLVNKLLFLSLS